MCREGILAQSLQKGFLKTVSKPGVGNLQPAGQIQPAELDGLQQLSGSAVTGQQ